MSNVVVFALRVYPIGDSAIILSLVHFIVYVSVKYDNYIYNSINRLREKVKKVKLMPSSFYQLFNQSSSLNQSLPAMRSNSCKRDVAFFFPGKHLKQDFIAEEDSWRRLPFKVGNLFLAGTRLNFFGN